DASHRIGMAPDCTRVGPGGPGSHAPPADGVTRPAFPPTAEKLTPVGPDWWNGRGQRSEEHTSELQSRGQLVCRLLLEKKNHKNAAGRIQPPYLRKAVLRQPRFIESGLLLRRPSGHATWLDWRPSFSRLPARACVSNCA